MSLRTKLIASTFAISFVLSVVTVIFFLVTASHQMDENTKRIYDQVAKSFFFIQKATAQSEEDVYFELEKCKIRFSNNYILISGEGLLIGRVRDCRFYGTNYRQVIELTAQLNDLSWFIVYDREIVTEIMKDRPSALDKFVGSRSLLNGMILEGRFDPALINQIGTFTGYKLINRFSTLIMDFPIVVEGSVPVGRVIFVKDFSLTLKEILFTPLIFMGYTLVLVVVLSSLLFVVFNRIVREVTALRKVAYKFKELDFSDIPKMSDELRKDKRRDEIYYLKRSILTMAQELEDAISKLKSEKEQFEELALKDPLTGLNNRRAFISESNRILDLAKRHGEPLSLLMLDIDNFKKINDTYGHDVGDLVLKKLAEVIKKNVRSSDIPARFGGEEFVILLPKTDEKGALLVAERIRKDFRNASVQVDGKNVWTSVSIGVAAFGGSEDLDALVKKADEALYQAKNSGKDRVVIYREEDQEQG